MQPNGLALLPSSVTSHFPPSAASMPPTLRTGNTFVKIVAIEVIRLSLAFDAGRRPVAAFEPAGRGLV